MRVILFEWVYFSFSLKLVFDAWNKSSMNTLFMHPRRQKKCMTLIIQKRRMTVMGNLNEHSFFSLVNENKIAEGIFTDINSFLCLTLLFCHYLDYGFLLFSERTLIPLSFHSI